MNFRALGPDHFFGSALVQRSSECIPKCWRPSNAKCCYCYMKRQKHGIRAPAVEPLVDSEVKYLTLCYHIDGFCVVLVRSTLTKASWSIRRRWNFMFWKFPTQRCRAERKKTTREWGKWRCRGSLEKIRTSSNISCFTFKPAMIRDRLEFFSNPVLDLPTQPASHFSACSGEADGVLGRPLNCNELAGRLDLGSPNSGLSVTFRLSFFGPTGSKTWTKEDPSGAAAQGSPATAPRADGLIVQQLHLTVLRRGSQWHLVSELWPEDFTPRSKMPTSLADIKNISKLSEHEVSSYLIIFRPSHLCASLFISIGLFSHLATRFPKETASTASKFLPKHSR